MKFYDKYPQLREKSYLAEMLIETVFSTMSLEEQEVPKPKIQQIVSLLLEEEELKGNQFFINKSI